MNERKIIITEGSGGVWKIDLQTGDTPLTPLEANRIKKTLSLTLSESRRLYALDQMKKQELKRRREEANQKLMSLKGN